MRYPPNQEEFDGQVEGIRYIQPEKPNQNAYIERFDRTYRTAEWMRTYNEERPHGSLGDKTPASYLEAVEAGMSTLAVST